MCRLYGFRSSTPSRVHHSLAVAENALARQSVRHPDGWGVAYYVERFPHLVRSAKRALGDRLFSDVSAVVSTRTLLAHIRQATVGKVDVLNCHPFQHGPWTFGHNGEVHGFNENTEGAQQLRGAIDSRFARHVLGTTDSEVCFHLFLSYLARRVDDIYLPGVSLDVALAALKDAVEIIKKQATATEEQPHRLTFLVTNGNILLGYRENRALYYSTFKTRCPERDTCASFDPLRCEAEVSDGLVKHLILSSERISEGPNVWCELEDGEYVAVDFGMNLRRGFLSEVGTPGGCNDRVMRPI